MSDVWPGEIPPGWELQWIESDDEEWWCHGWPPVTSWWCLDFRCFNLWTLSCFDEQGFVINGPHVGSIRINLVKYSGLTFMWVLIYTTLGSSCK
jgi:hypothetical protein